MIDDSFYVVAGKHRANTLEAANEIAADIFDETGAIASIEYMPTVLTLYCEDCSVVHIGESPRLNQYGQVVYTVWQTCPHNDYLTSMAREG